MRINILPPSLLADQHLQAEYREIKMLPKAFIRSLNSFHSIKFGKISKTYTLNAGHGYFFYNKFKYIERRFQDILTEMRYRGFATNFDKLDLSGIPSNYFHDWSPSKEEQLVNLERILLRISDKPQWYKYKGKTQDWNEFYKELM
jgi:deoxyribonuclease (pyrimidine dimer)